MERNRFPFYKKGKHCLANLTGRVGRGFSEQLTSNVLYDWKEKNTEEDIEDIQAVYDSFFIGSDEGLLSLDEIIDLKALQEE